MAHHLHFDEVGRDRFKSRDGRFTLRHEQRNGHHDFYIFDAQSKTPEREVGRATTMTKVVSFCRQYLNKERDAMLTGVRQAEKAPTVKAGVERGGQPVAQQVIDAKHPTPQQRVLAALCEAADADGVFRASASDVSRRTGVARSSVEVYIRQFMAAGWLVVLERSHGGSHKTGGGSTYGFNIPVGTALCYVQDMPKLPPGEEARRQVAREREEEQRRKAAPVVQQPPAPAAVPAETLKVNPAIERAADIKQPSEIGLMAGRAMVKVGKLEDRVLALEGGNDLLRQLVKELQERVASLEDVVKQLATAPRNEDEYAGVLEYLEQSQRRVNAFLKSAFGVDVEGGE
jgi:hypothetical protein